MVGTADLHEHTEHATINTFQPVFLLDPDDPEVKLESRGGD